MYELTVHADFAAAHRLREYEGACERLHGHNWKVDVVVGSERLNRLGLVMDFRDLKTALAEVLGRLDHEFLNEKPPFDTINPSTENIAKWVCEQLSARMPEGVAVRSVTAWETDRCGATYLP